MSHPDEARLIEHALGDSGAPDHDEIVAHVAGCAACARELEDLRRVLSSAAIEVPARDADYGARVWRRVEPRLVSRSPSWPAARLSTSHRALAAAAAVLIAVSSFLLGRWSHPAPPAATMPAAVESTDARAIHERVVLADLGQHLDRAERALLEISNADAGGPVDIEAERAWARDLLEANRLYRHAARGTASPLVVDLLTDIEPILLEIVNSPAHMAPGEIRALQARIASRSLVFKLRVSGAQLRGRPPSSSDTGVPRS